MEQHQKQSTEKVDNTRPTKTAPKGMQVENLCTLQRGKATENSKSITHKQKSIMEKKATTHDRSLNTYEQNVLLPVLMNGLEAKKDSKSAVTAREISEKLREHGLKISENQVFRIINFIRINDLMVGLVGGRKGYYMASTKRDLMEYEERLKKHEESLKRVRMSIKRQRNGMFAPPALQKVHLF